MTFLSKTWTWFKKYWKWIVFPVGLVSLVISAIAGAKVLYDVDPNKDKLDEADEHFRRAVEEANTARDQKLLELAEEHQERLDDLSDSQERELESLTEKPIEEVVAWFDGL